MVPLDRCSGSSPLARGLRMAVVMVVVMAGIIPARAGFTGDRPGSRLSRRDHPRSRGVYASRPAGVAAVQGSSPLARGLHGAGVLLARLPGIIPARAGFTCGRSSPPRSPRDHPRSRGVYPPEPRGQRGARGSSPLARGLRAGRRPHLLDQRIIPARAGFTDHRGPADRGPRDHPRSRGVYTLTGTTSSSSSGSSPLARGLPSHMGTDAWPEGIIPARAGFTPRCPRRCCRRPDHPRSRGVYTPSPSP